MTSIVMIMVLLYNGMPVSGTTVINHFQSMANCQTQAVILNSIKDGTGKNLYQSVCIDLTPR